MNIYFCIFQTVNENSLKQLSSYIETIQSHRPVVPCNLQFYLREIQNNVHSNKFQVVNIHLREADLRNTIHTILKTCNLSTQYLDNVAPPVEPSKFYGKPKPYPHDYDVYGTIVFHRKIKKVKESLNLR